MKTTRHLGIVAALALCVGLLAASPAAADPVFALGAGEPAPQPVGGVMGLPALADPVLWYNGDFDSANGLANCMDGAWGAAAIVYDNFIVPAGETWEVQRVWTNNLMGFSPEMASWQIRQGVSAGDGGTLIASGTDYCVLTPTGRNGFGYYEYTVEVQGLSILLGAGEYWLAVAPIDFGYADSYCTTTSGDNAIGQPQGDDWNAYFCLWDYGLIFTPTTDQGLELHDFSMGVAGEVVGRQLIPEPATLSLVGLGLLAAAAWRRRRQ